MTEAPRDLLKRLTGFTLGPWTLDATDPGDVVVWAEDSELVVNVGQRVQQTTVAFDFDERNGALIAAAPDLHRELAASLAREAGLRHALVKAEGALSDIGDAEREEGDDLEWCERRAAEDIPLVRAALAVKP